MTSNLHTIPLNEFIFTTPVKANTIHPIYGSAHIPIQEQEKSPSQESSEPSSSSNSNTNHTPPQVHIKASRESLLKAIQENDSYELDSLLSQTNSLEFYPLLLAASVGQLDMLKRILNRPDQQVDYTDKEGETALLKASLNGHALVVKYLIQKGANPTHADKEGYTALHNAASRGLNDVASIIIVQGDVDCNVQSNKGYTPLMNAARQGHIDMVRILLDSGANPLIKNKYEETAYDLAAQEERAYICHLLQSSESKWIANQYVTNLDLQSLSKSELLDKIHTTCIEIVNENQRYSTLNMQYSDSYLTSTDINLIGGAFSTPYGRAIEKQEIELPDSNWFWLTDWQVDTSYPSVDLDGWLYAHSFEIHESHWNVKTPPKLFGFLGGTLVRKRRWIRVRKKKMQVIHRKPIPISDQLSFHTEEDDVNSYLQQALALVESSIGGHVTESSDSMASVDRMIKESQVYERAITLLLEGMKGDNNTSRKQRAANTADAYLRHAETLKGLLDTLNRSSPSQSSISRSSPTRSQTSLSRRRSSPIVETASRDTLSHYESLPDFPILESTQSEGFLATYRPNNWQADEDAPDCRKCEISFSLFIRRHHCRWCGYVYCDECSSFRLSLNPKSLFQDRVCQDCFTYLTSHDTPLAHLIPSPPSPTRNYRSSLTDSIMNECPVCQVTFSRLRLSDEDVSKHIAECLDKASGPSIEITGNMYIISTLEKDLNKECTICFEEFIKGQRIARLNCLCFYHVGCIDAWLSNSHYGVRACPVHYT